MPTGLATPGLGRRAARGAASTGVGLLLRIGLQFASIAVLARLLSPGDYGLITMVTAVINVGDTVRDFGLSSAAIQAPTLSRGQRSNLFWVNTAIGLTLTVLAVVAAYPIAAVNREPALVGITQALAVTFLLNGMMTQYRASLLRAMRFTHVAAVDVVAPAVALVVTIAMAAAGAGYWALVGQQLAQSVVALVAVVLLGRWLPSPRWFREPMRRFFTFGGHLLGSQLIGYAANNVDSLVTGIRMGKGVLGEYSRAFQLVMNPLNQVRAPSTTVAIPILARAGRSEQYDEIVRSGQLVLGYATALAMGVAIGTAHPLLRIVLGPGWTQVPVLFQLLCAAGVFQTLAYVGYWVYLSRGLTRQLMHYTVVTSAIKIVAILAGSSWGVVGVAVGYAISHALEWPLSLWWLSRITDLPTRDLYHGASRVVGAGTALALASAGGVALLAGHGAWPQLTVGLVAATLALGLLFLIPAIRRDLAVLLRAARAALRRGSS